MDTFRVGLVGVTLASYDDGVVVRVHSHRTRDDRVDRVLREITLQDWILNPLRSAGDLISWHFYDKHDDPVVTNRAVVRAKRSGRNIKDRQFRFDGRRR